MTAATLARTPERGLDRLVLATGLALVAWSRRRSARRLRVAAPGTRRLSTLERADRMYDPYSAEAVRSHGLPPTLLR
ncbi:MAG: hypothetical protein JWP75_1374 [Frondihabitans sp.]|nr:hypothetical protein [Frondihabitans sp.]